MHALGLWQAGDDLAEEFAAEDLPELEGAVYYRRALEAYQQKGVINAAEMQSMLDAVPMAGSIAEDGQLRQKLYNKAFTMVREADQTIIENVSSNFRQQIKKGGTVSDFVHDINDVYDSAGIDNQQKWYSELVYKNNMRRVRQEGLDAAAKRSNQLGTLWGYRWVHSGSDNPRPAHLALNGFEAPKNDPRWSSIGIPPVGHNCGCQRVPVSNYRARKKGLSNAPETPRITGGDYAGTDAIKGLDEIPGERFGPSQYNIEARPLINPSEWGGTILKKPVSSAEKGKGTNVLQNIHPSKEYQEQFIKERQASLQAYAADLDTTTESLKQSITKKVKESMKSTEIAIRVPDENILNSILHDGRFKTQFETNTSGGALIPEKRKEFESLFMGYTSKTPAKQRPIYGMLNEVGNDDLPGEWYGNVSVKLKDHVKQRTTWVSADSLDKTAKGERAVFKPSPVTNPDSSGVFLQPDWEYSPAFSDILEEKIEKFPTFSKSVFAETQIHGGVTTQDIKEVLFDKLPQSDTIKTLNKQNISWRVKGE